jgi:hypothetical protein
MNDEKRLLEAAKEINARLNELLKARGVLLDPNDWLSEADIVKILGRHLAGIGKANE